MNSVLHFSIKGRSRETSIPCRAASKAAYILREGRYSFRAQELRARYFGNLPSWASAPTDFWGAVDAYERSNGRLYTDIVGSFPQNLPIEGCVRAAKIFALKHTSDKFPFTLAVHESHSDGVRNAHLHLMVSPRQLDGIERDRESFFLRANATDPALGGAEKSHVWAQKVTYYTLRRSWATIVSAELKKAGVSAVVTEQSLQELGVTQEPHEEKQSGSRTPLAAEDSAQEFRRDGSLRFEGTSKSPDMSEMLGEVNRFERILVDIEKERRRLGLIVQPDGQVTYPPLPDRDVIRAQARAIVLGRSYRVKELLMQQAEERHRVAEREIDEFQQTVLKGKSVLSFILQRRNYRNLQSEYQRTAGVLQRARDEVERSAESLTQRDVWEKFEKEYLKLLESYEQMGKNRTTLDELHAIVTEEMAQVRQIIGNATEQTPDRGKQYQSPAVTRSGGRAFP